jgi:hypothetical protein
MNKRAEKLKEIGINLDLSKLVINFFFTSKLKRI